MSDVEPTRRRGIVFNRVAPVKALPDFVESPFPDRRTIHWVPPDLAMTEGFSIVITSEVLLQVSRHVARTLERELGGFLLGNHCRCPNTGREYIIIDQYLEAKDEESTGVSFTFRHESWGQLEANLSGKLYGKKLLGWYHSHPTMSIFLSEDDIALHRARFSKHWEVALVLEPDKHIGGFFVWNNGKIDPNRYVNFYELLDGGSRESVVAWKNYHGVDPLNGTAPVVSANNTLSGPGQALAPLGVAASSVTATDRQDAEPEPPRGGLYWVTATAALALAALIGWAGVTLYQNWRQQRDIAERRLVPAPTPTSEQIVSVPSPSPSPSPTQTQQESRNTNTNSAHRQMNDNNSRQREVQQARQEERERRGNRRQPQQRPQASPQINLEQVRADIKWLSELKQDAEDKRDAINDPRDPRYKEWDRIAKGYDSRLQKKVKLLPPNEQ